MKPDAVINPASSESYLSGQNHMKPDAVMSLPSVAKQSQFGVTFGYAVTSFYRSAFCAYCISRTAWAKAHPT